ncbi:MAG: hypothetical protein WDW38_008057 [Sanguina aurantia]
MRATWFTFITLLLSVCFISAQEECGGPVVAISVLSNDQSLKKSQQGFTLYGVVASFGEQYAEQTSFAHGMLFVPEPANITACNDSDLPEDVTGAVVVVLRGNCSFAQKAEVVQRANGSAMLLYDNIPGCVTMGSSEDDANTTSGITIPLISITQAAGQRLVAAATMSGGGGAAVEWSVTLQPAVLPSFDGSAVILWVVAIATVIVGSLWSGSEYLSSRAAAANDIDEHKAEPVSMDVMDISPTTAVMFVASSSAILLLMFFFLNKVFFFILLGLFCLGSIQAMVVVTLALADALLPPSLACHHTALPYLGATQSCAVAAVPLCTALSIGWAVARNSAWSWTLQDVQGVALMLVALRTLRLPNMQVACILLPLVFCYDIFFVFVQPWLTGGDSVMVRVAEGGGTHEFLPMLLRVPHLGPPHLGGIRHARLWRRDPARRWTGGYFPATVLAYTAGLCLTYVALVYSWFGDQGQPALAYLVPCTLGTVLSIGWFRQDLGVMFGAGKKVYAPVSGHDHDVARGEGPRDLEVGESGDGLQEVGPALVGGGKGDKS